MLELNVFQSDSTWPTQNQNWER